MCVSGSLNAKLVFAIVIQCERLNTEFVRRGLEVLGAMQRIFVLMGLKILLLSPLVKEGWASLPLQVFLLLYLPIVLLCLSRDV